KSAAGLNAMNQDIVVPDLGDFQDVEVIDVLVREGDAIGVDEPLVTLETEKATMDVPSTVAGVVKAIAVKKGSRVSAGSRIAVVEVQAAEGSPAKPAAETPRQQPSART